MRRRNRRIFASLDFLTQGEEVYFFTVEGRLQGGHFVQEASEWPDVRFEIVARLLESLWRHVVRCTDQRVDRHGLGAEEAAQAQVAQLDDALGCEEHVGRLDVSVHNSLAVHVIQGATELHEKTPDGPLRQQLMTTLALDEKMTEITGVGQLQNDLQLAIFHKRLDVAHHVRMIQLLDKIKMVL